MPVIARLSLIALVAIALAPGTFVRTPVVQGLDLPVRLRAIDEPGVAPPAGWTLEGVWEYEGDGLLFGGYSALLALDGARLQAFSDRGGRFTFLQPDQPQPEQLQPEHLQGPQPLLTRRLAEQRVQTPFEMLLFDIEAASRDPATGQYWLAFESLHAFHRYSASHAGEGVRIIAEEIEWPGNSGAEAMARLADGRFLVIRESGEEGLLYPADPIDGGAPVPVIVEPPPGDFSVTDAAQLPDGRILLLLRRVARGIPPFTARIALAEWDGEATVPVLSPRIVLDLSAVAPPENYEGVAVRARADGAVDVWVISDDNLSVMQRTLVAKLRLEPDAARQRAARRSAGQPAVTKQTARR